MRVIKAHTDNPNDAIENSQQFHRFSCTNLFRSQTKRLGQAFGRHVLPPENREKSHIRIGVLALPMSGKTTLCEAMLSTIPDTSIVETGR